MILLKPALQSAWRINLLLFFAINLSVAQPTAIFNLHFDLDRDELTTEASNQLYEAIGDLPKPEVYRAVLIGHTDQQGSLSYNQDLSERRAETVKNFLVDNGFVAEQVEYSGKAFLDLMIDQTTEAAYAKNRRVSVIFEKDYRNVPSNYYYLSAQQPTSIKDDRSGTEIDIPENAFATADGAIYEGEVILMYREFRDFADFMATDMPMNFDGGERGHFYFNSTGMFEMRAFDEEGHPLGLNNGKSIDLAYPQSQLAVGAQVWQFNDEKNRWQNGEDQLAFTGETERISVPVDTIDRLLDSLYLGVVSEMAIQSDVFLGQLNTAYERIPEIIGSTTAYSNNYSPLLDGNSFRTRFRGRNVKGLYAGTHYVGHLDSASIHENPMYYNIAPKEVEETASAIIIQFEDLSGENPEWASLAGSSWKIRKKDLKVKKLDKDQLLARFADLRVSHQKRMRHFRLQLKLDGKVISLPAIWHKMDGQTANRKARELAFNQYRKDLRVRRKAFDQKIKEQSDELNYYLTALKLLLPKDLGLDSLQFSFMDIATSIHNIHWKESRMKRYYDDRAGKDPMRLGGRSFLVAQAAHLKEHYLNRSFSKDQWITLLKSFDPRVSYDEVTYVTTYKELGNPVPRFNISTLGVFNFDVLKRFKEEQELMAQFKDEAGQHIDFARVEVINHRLNGLLRYKKEKIHIDLKSPNTLVVYAKDGRVFYLKADELMKLDLQNRKAYAFTVKDLGDYRSKPSLFRNLLSYADNG
ncbi:MAG: OmpA family protein [Saprospiraceae bacterium]|nr:OmpA family protein [Saprospiraceae bacterium]